VKKIAGFFVLSALTTFAIAEVITLTCIGTNPAGQNKTYTVTYDESRGWVKDNPLLNITDGVSAETLTGFHITVDRRTGEFRTRRPPSPDLDFKGTCEKMIRKF